jgi:hypothetical protein
MTTALAAEAGSAVALVATEAMAVADDNRNFGGGQQLTKCGRGSNRDSGLGSGDHGSAALTAGRGGSMAEVTMMRAAATETTVVVNLYPLEGRDMEVNTNKCQVDTHK